MRRVLLLLTLVFSVASAAAAQPVPIQPTGDGVMLTFQDADLGFVLAALAQSAGVNLVYNDLPAKPITLRTATPVPLSAIPALIRSIAAANGIAVFEEGGFLRLRGGGPEAVEPDGRELFVLRLRHARAAVLAGTLQQLFGGGGGGPITSRPATGGQALSQQLRALQEQGVNVQVPPEARAAFTVGIAGSLEGNVLIVPDETTNSLLVRATPTDWQVVQQAVQVLDLRPLQVLIEVVIAEVRRTDDLNLGVSFSAIDSDNGDTVELLDENTPQDFTVRFSRTGEVDVEATLAALSATGNVRILSRPVIQAQNNQEARILVGAQRPFVSVSRSLPTNDATRDQVVQYRDVGTSLTILPTINPEGYVNLALTQEVSSATNETQFDAPIISTREATTQLLARDGQTIVIGGLVDRQQDQVRAGIPLLKDIPILGYLFGTTRDSEETSELFLFLTPHIVETDADADRLKQEIEQNTELLQPFTPVQPLIPPDTTRVPAPPQ